VTVTNQESTITPTDFNSVPAGSPLCVQGTVANPPQGYGYAELALAVDEEALRASLPVDAGTDAAADAGTTSYESNSIVPTSDGLIVHVRNAGNSPLSLCLDGANDDTWCVTDVSQGPFFPWSSFRDNFGSGAVAYDRQPIVDIYLNASVAGSAASTPFAFCLDNLAEAASWCGCMGDACACPMGTTVCNATCVLDTAINPSDCGASDLVETAKARDQARLRKGDADEALRRWPPLTRARWTLVDRFERNGAKYIVARENQSQVRGLASLSDRERQVAAYLAIGQSTKETAYALGISDATVRVLLARAASKLGVRTRADLLGHAEVRLLCPPPCNEPAGPTAPSISATPGKRKA
jgi:DNA-binding CsgD family transcriptional regulator